MPTTPGYNPLLKDEEGQSTTAVDGPAAATAESRSTNEDDVESSRIEEGRDNNRLLALPRRRRRKYAAVPSEDEEGETEEENQMEEEDEENMIWIVILDSAQQKFNIQVHPERWTVGKLKSKGQEVHKVPPNAQRLVFRGKLLQDAITLADSGITEANTIVHLFPKPRVLIQEGGRGASRETGREGATDDEEENDDSDAARAHIPQIVLDPREAEQRASILVLGSTDFIEAQNNVKLFSFLLLVVSTLELVSLFGILVGIPITDQDLDGSGGFSGDDAFYPHFVTNDDDNMANNGTAPPTAYDSGVEYVQWQFSNNFDLLISVFGIWVAMTGLQASNENRLKLAQQYLWGTFVVGVAWMAYNFWVSVQIDKEDDIRHWEYQQKHNSTNTHYHEPLSDAAYYQQNLNIMFLPGMVWFLCCVRAWQFQYLLGEAEREAVGRIQSELEQHASTYPSSSGGDGEISEEEDQEVEQHEDASHDVENQISERAIT